MHISQFPITFSTRQNRARQSEPVAYWQLDLAFSNSQATAPQKSVRTQIPRRCRL